MNVYWDMKCQKCRKIYKDILVHEKEIMVCKECGGELIKIYTGSPTIIFKGEWNDKKGGKG